MTLSIRAVAPEALYDLRRLVLRENDPAVDVSDPRDHDGDARHFAGFLDDQLVVCGSIYASVSPLHETVPAHQLRYLATHFDVQGLGYGAALLDRLEQAAWHDGAREIWANGRDTALAFYRRQGWQLVPGSEHLSPYTGLPHTVIWKSLNTTT